MHATTEHTIVMETWEDLRPLVDGFGSFVHLPCTWRHSIEPAVPLLGSDGAHPMRLEAGHKLERSVRSAYQKSPQRCGGTRR